MLYGWAALVNAIFHYVPLHLSPARRRFGRAVGSMTETLAASERLIRLPLWVGMPAETCTMSSTPSQPRSNTSDD